MKSYDELSKENERLSNENAVLKRALDKVCEFNDNNYVIFEEDWICGHDCSKTLSSGEWKEWAMKNE